MGQKAGQKSRGNGEGNVRKKSDGRWEARITIGKTEAGKQKMKYFYGRTRDDAQAKLNDFLSENQHGTYIEPSKYTVAQWLDEWYNKHVVGSVKPSTRVSYEMIIRQHLKPNFGHYKLKDLGSGTIQSVYKKLLKSGRVIRKKADDKKDEKPVNKGLSEKTIRNIHLVLRKALQVAYLDDMIPRNPAADGRVTLPEAPKKKEIRVFTPDEQKAIERACKGERWGMNLFHPQALKDMGVQVGMGAAAGAMAGAAVDLLSAGLSLGTGMLIGAAAGGLWQGVEKLGKRVAGKLRGWREISVDDAVLRLLALRQRQLIEALERRGHAAREPLKLDQPEDDAWRKGPLPEALKEARSRPEWSALAPGHEDSERRKQVVRELAKASKY